MSERYEHDFDGGECQACGLSHLCEDVECPALLRTALDESMARTTSWMDDYDVAREELDALRADAAQQAADAAIAQAVAALLTTWRAQYAERKEHQSEWYAKVSHAEKQLHSNAWTVEFVLRDEAIRNLETAIAAATAAARGKA